MDGPHLSLRPLVPIKKNEEITISYVDGTMAYTKRQAELENLYFFKCACSKCLEGTGTVEDKFLLPRDEVQARLEAFDSELQTNNPIYDLSGFSSSSLSSIEGIVQAGEDEILAIKTVPEAQISGRLDADLQLLSRTKIWPLHWNPYRGLRDAQFQHYLTLGEFHKALWQGLRTYFTINPVLYPEKHHPIRVIQTYTCAVLTLVVLSENVESGSGGPDFSILLNTLLEEVVSNVTISHGNESRFAQVVRRKFNEVNADMIRYNPNGLVEMKTLSPATMKSFQVLTDRMVPY
jgi:hypothetical protein